MADMLPLVQVPRALRAHGVCVNYHKVWRHIIAGDIPAQQADNKAWMIAEADLPSIAQALARK
jgi:hypothetical protein